MYNEKDIQFVGKFDYDKSAAEKFASWGGDTFSVGIFKWLLKNNLKSMKRSKVVVRVHGSPSEKEKVFCEAEKLILFLDGGGKYTKKNITV